MAQAAVNWHWRPAQGTDITAMVDLTQHDFEREAENIWRTDRMHYTHNLTRAVVDQFFSPSMAMVWLAVGEQNLIRGYVWAERGQKTVWSPEEMVAIKIVHVDLALSARQRVTLCDEMITLWERWAQRIGVDLIASTSMREQQEGFMRLHQRRGYQRRGSICYRRLSPESAGHEADDGHEHTDGAHMHSIPAI